ncbi:MAG: carboxypeptidase-like regulatory domain-containing protein, partial [Bacteroidota bacterium]
MGLSSGVYAQTASIRGSVVDKATAEPLYGAHIALFQNGLYITGAASNVDGFFTVRNVEPGQYTFQVSFIGFQSYEERVHLDRGETLLRG